MSKNEPYENPYILIGDISILQHGTYRLIGEI